MNVALSRIISGVKSYYGTYDLSDMSEAKAFTYAVWKFGECGNAAVIERAEDGKNQIGKVDYKEKEPMDESRMIDRETRYADEIGIRAYEQGKRDMAKELKTEVEKIFNDRPRSYNHNQRTELYVKVLQLLEKAEGKKE